MCGCYVSPTRPWIQTACVPVGPYGGSGGGPFLELPDNCNAIVSKIYIRSGAKVDAIQVTYTYSDGSEHTFANRGGNGGGPSTVTIDVSSGERLIGVSGRSGAKVDQLSFITNFGRTFGPYGGNGGGPFTANGCILKGIHGRSGEKLDSIGFFCDEL